MIFLGDLACPAEKVDDFNESVSKLNLFAGEVIIINLEAVILQGGSNKCEKLYNHPDVLDTLKKKAKKIIVSLANNHMYDYPDEILKTKALLIDGDIGVFGLQEADGRILPYEYNDESGKYAFFGHCWNLYSATNPNNRNNVKIVDVDYGKFLLLVSSYIKTHPDRKVYCFMHWNYDLEKYPFPMHIQLSHDLIDAGASGVIGSHSHIPQGVEIYKGKPIAYCLGNLYLPSGVFFNGRLSYPEESKKTIALNINGNQFNLLHFETDKKEPLRFMGAEDLKQSKNLISFESGRQYVPFFRKNRVKRILVPVFEGYSGLTYKFKNKWAIYRVKAIKQILKLIQK